MAMLPSVKIQGFFKPHIHSGMESETFDDETIEYVEGKNRIVVDSTIAKDAIKSILLSEISEYVSGAFRLTCENINNMIEKYNQELLLYTEKKIDASAQVLAESLVTRIIKEKMSNEFIDNLIKQLIDLKTDQHETR